MITDKDLSRITKFRLEPNGNYSDWEDWQITPIDKSRTRWIFYSHDCVNGDLEELFRTDNKTTLEEFIELCYHVMHEELQLFEHEPEELRKLKFKSL
ncbi:hypothetical protein M0Q50_03310 [bacterium]|jgi:hypothetical protein|nr:hypothetical protein [bacterium]